MSALHSLYRYVFDHLLFASEPLPERTRSAIGLIRMFQRDEFAEGIGDRVVALATRIVTDDNAYDVACELRALMRDLDQGGYADDVD